jgi:hypothetical protein
MDDQKTPPQVVDNVVKGPWSVKSGRKVKLPDKDIIALQQNLHFAEELTESLMVQMIHSMGENGIDVSEKAFIRDMAMIIEMVKGSIYRDMGLDHPTHMFMEEYVDIIINEDNTFETEVDFDTIDTIIKLADMLDDEEDDDDDPKVP